MPTILAGFFLGLSLILAIGAQNAFVLKQGLRRQYVLMVCMLCALSDALLIVLGVAGMGAMVQQFPFLLPVTRYGGAAFLLGYGLLSFYSAFKRNHLVTPVNTANSAGKTAAVCLALTWLNPHVYLDTMILIGSVSTRYGDAAWHFGGGAVAASFVFFFSLGYGARFLAPLFERALTWRILDALIGATMLTIALSLVLN